MVLNVYSIRDKLVAYQSPFYMHSDEQAIRSFKMAVNAETPNSISQAFADMDLYRLGTFDDMTGVFTSEVVFLTNGAELKTARTAPAAVEASTEKATATPARTSQAADPLPGQMSVDDLSALRELLKKKEVKDR